LLWTDWCAHDAQCSVCPSTVAQDFAQEQGPPPDTGGAPWGFHKTWQSRSADETLRTFATCPVFRKLSVLANAAAPAPPAPPYVGWDVHLTTIRAPGESRAKLTSHLYL